MEDQHEILRKQLGKAMRDAEFSQSMLAEKMGIKQSHLSEILSGRKRMGRKTLGAVLRVFPNLKPYVMSVIETPDKGAA